MSAPINLVEAIKRGLIIESGKGIHQFSNGSERCDWQDGKCFDCWFWPKDGPAGEFCAFEASIDFQTCSPELARLFGWVRDDESAAAYYRETGETDDLRSWFHAPQTCPHFQQRPEKGDDEDETPPPPPTDPHQLVLIADPTEDLALFPATAPARETVSA